MWRREAPGQCECTAVVLTLRVFLSGGLAPQEVPTDWAGQRHQPLPVHTEENHATYRVWSLHVKDLPAIRALLYSGCQLPASYCGGQVQCQESGRGTGFYPNFSVFPYLHHCMYTPVTRISPRRCRVSPSDAAVLYGFSFFLTQENKKSASFKAGP